MNVELFELDRHENLTNKNWSAEIVSDEIRAFVRDSVDSIRIDNGWKTHSLDSTEFNKAGTLWSLYAGAAGVVLALNILKRYNFSTYDVSTQALNIYNSYLNDPDIDNEFGLQIGEIGVLMPIMMTLKSDDHELNHRMCFCMEKTLGSQTYEITSGQTGMMHAALALFRITDNHEWKKLYIKGANSLLGNWKHIEELEQWHWDSKIFGQTRQYYGACHGVAGNANVLMLGIDLLRDDIQEIIIRRSIQTLEKSALKHNSFVNWQINTSAEPGKPLVQWCHGAAGVVTALASIPRSETLFSDKLDELLQKAGELVWKAGPLTKGAGLCHGTSGNGYAFLYLYKRWGDRKWLDRARKFAMHAIEQSNLSRDRFGQRRYTLYTGDAGLAIYLCHCLNPEETAIPGLELF